MKHKRKIIYAILLIFSLLLNNIVYATGEIEYTVNTLGDIINLLQENGQIFNLYQKSIILPLPPLAPISSDKSGGVSYSPEKIWYITASESETAPMILFDDELMYWYSYSNHNKNNTKSNSVILKTSGISHDEKCEDKSAYAITNTIVQDITNYSQYKNLKVAYNENIEENVGAILEKNTTETVIDKFNKWFNGFRYDRVLYPGKNTGEVIKELSTTLGLKESYIPSEIKTGKVATKSDIKRTIIPVIDYVFECEGCGAQGTVTVANLQNILEGNNGDFTINCEYGQEGIGANIDNKNIVNSSFNYFNKNYKTNKSIMNKEVFKTTNEYMSFYPYIKMRYSTAEDKTFKDVYITSSNKSKIAENIVVNISTEEIKPETLYLESQWVNHMNARNTMSSNGIYNINSIVAGGANIGIKSKNELNKDINSNNICIESYITCIPSVMVPNFEEYTYTEATAMTELAKFKNSIKNTLSNYFIEKWASEGLYNSEDEFIKKADVVNGYNEVSKLGNNTLNRSNSKYYLNNNSVDKTKNSKVIANVDNELIDIYTAQVNTYGDILLYKNNEYQGCIYKSSFNSKYYETVLKGIGKDEEWFILNNNSKLIDNLVASLDSNLGDSGRYNGYKGWYNEAIDGVSVIRQVLDINISLDVDKFDIQDPALNGKLDSKVDLWSNEDITNKWRTLQYRLSDRAYRNGAYETPYIIGNLCGNPIYFDGIENILKSKLFYIGNGTVEDLQ